MIIKISTYINPVLKSTIQLVVNLLYFGVEDQKTSNGIFGNLESGSILISIIVVDM